MERFKHFLKEFLITCGYGLIVVLFISAIVIGIKMSGWLE